MSKVRSIAAPTRNLTAAGVWWRAPIVGAALIALATCVAYWPARDGGFVLDDDLLLQNELVKDPAGLYRIWFTTDAVDYWPVSNTLFWIEWRLWGKSPLGYHVVNVLLHIGVSLLVWRVLRRLSIPGALLAGLLFAVHPVNVESVAWISQLKTILAALFFLLSVDLYLLSEEPERASRWYWLSLVAFVLGMFSKASIVMLPLVLPLLKWWINGTITRRDLARVAPFFLVAAPLTLVNLWFRHHGADEVIRNAGFVERLLGAGLVPWFYLSKALWPSNLIYIYPMWQINVGSVLWWLPLAATIAATIVLLRKRQTTVGRALLFAWAFYLLALAPVMGFADVTYMKWSLVADHYQYVAIVAVVATVAAAFAWLWHRSISTSPAAPWAVGIATTTLVGSLMATSWQLSSTYRDAITLYGVTLARNPACWMAYNNIGLAFNEAGRREDAIRSLEAALQLQPDYPEAHNNLGGTLYLAGRQTEALNHFREALRLRPDYPDVYYNLAKDRMNVGRPQEALAYYQKALELRPTYADAHNDLGLLLLSAGQIDQAVEHLQKAVRYKPDDALVHNSLGTCLLSQGQTPSAIEHFEKAIELQPNYARAQLNLGLALVRTGQTLPAIEHYEQAVKLEPSSVDARTNLGSALLTAKRLPEAVEQFRQAAALEPNSPQVHNNLGAASLTAGDPAAAINSLQRAVQLSPDYLEAWTSLAAAHQQTQRVTEAIAAAERALELARARGNTQFAERLSALLESLQGEQPKAAGASSEPTLPPPAP